MRIYSEIQVFICFSEKNLVVYHDQGHYQGHDQGHDHDRGHDHGHDQKRVQGPVPATLTLITTLIRMNVLNDYVIVYDYGYSPN